MLVLLPGHGEGVVEVERLLARVQPREVHHLRPQLHHLRRGRRLGARRGVRVRELPAAALPEVLPLRAVESGLLLLLGALRVGRWGAGGGGGVGVGRGGFGGFHGAVDEEVVVERVGGGGKGEEPAREAGRRRRRREEQRRRRGHCRSAAPKHLAVAPPSVVRLRDGVIAEGFFLAFSADRKSVV